MGTEQVSETLTISEAARRLHVSPKTLRVWCDRGLVECLRLPSGYRRFTQEQIEQSSQAMQRRPRGRREGGNDLTLHRSAAGQAEIPPLVARFDALRVRFALREFSGSTAELLDEAREERLERL